MQPKNSKKNEGNEAEAISRCGPFESFSFEAKDAGTAILLLQSKEKSILLATVKALSQYASESMDNIKMLFDLDIVKNILPIIEHEDIFTRRFATKLLVEMTTLPDVTTYFIETNYLPHFSKLLTTEEDTFMQEYFSAILVELSKDPCGTALLVEYCPNMDFLFEKIKSSDPDVKNNNIEILHNLMQDPVGARKILKSQEFNFASLFQHFESSYPEIQQHALIIVATLIGMNKDEDVQSLFVKANGVQTLLNFLKNDEWSDLHIEALRILSRAVENPSIADEFINSEGTPQVLVYIENAASSEHFTEVFKIIAHIADTSYGRKILHSHGVIEYLINTLEQSTESDVVEVACHAIGKMALYNPAAEEFARRKSIEIILDILKNEDLQWSARHTACYALKQLLTSNIRNCDIFVNLHGQDYLLELMKQSEKQVPTEICIIALEALIVTARHPPLRNFLINFSTVDTICLLLESTYPCVDEFKIACCNLLSALCLERDGRRYLLEANGPERLYALITDAHSIPIRNSAVQLTQTISTDLVAADAFVKSKYLRYMLNNRSSARVIPSWDTCIETLFKSHLPAKFAFTGRLSLRDVTQDAFYVLRKSICPFPALEEIFRLKCSPIEPIYTINFSQPLSSVSENEIPFEGDLNSQLELRYGRLQHDPQLIEYLEHFKCMLSTTESGNAATEVGIGLTDIQYISSRSKMLARFVARQMSGLDPENKCIPYQLEVHLKEIKEHLGTNVIPLGQLRVGSYLERALLFKVIADKVCLPAALVRGGYGISWIEVAIPRIEDSSEERFRARPSTYLYESDEYRSKIITPVSSELSGKSDACLYDKYKREKVSLLRYDRSTIYPIKHMKPNFIVDLMDTPGDLIPIGSPRSKLYCTAKLTCDKKCCQ